MLLAALLTVCFKRLTIVAVGDVMLARHVGRQIRQHGVQYPFELVRRHVEEGDLSLGNLECCLTTRRNAVAKRIILIAPPTSAQAINLTLVNLANNHSLDAGSPGLRDTMTYLTRAETAYAGIASGLDQTATVLEARGKKIAVLGYSCFRPRGVGGEPSIAYYDRDHATLDVKRARSAADYVIVMMHWGTEGSSVPDAQQRTTARELAKAGAHAVIGSHPHVLQPVERIDGCVVAYSLGNFVFDATRPVERETALLRMEFGEEGVTSWKLIPAHIRGGRPVS